MASRVWRFGGATLGAAAILLTACSSDPRPSSGITLATLSATTGTACAVPLDVVASTSGVDSTTPAAGSVTIGRLADQGASAVFPASDAELVDGVEVTCTLATSDGSQVKLTLLAGKGGDAGATVVPAAASAAGLDDDQRAQLANDIARTKIGALVPVPGTNAVAVMRTKVSGASTATILLSSEQLKRGQIEQLARQLDTRLR
jgi:hypothetical protein